MASTIFQDYNQNNPIVAEWLNDINTGVYSPGGVPKKAVQSSAAWARFAVVGGVITVNQSYNVSGVIRGGVGIYTIDYTIPLTQTLNCYSLSMSQAGFMFVTLDATGAVTINTMNTANVPVDPAFISVVVYGAN